MHQTADTFTWFSLRSNESINSMDSNGKTIFEAHNVIELTQAGNQYRVLYDQKSANLPISTVSFDGKVLRTLTERKNRPKALSIGVGNQEFMDLFRFWPIFGFYSFSARETLESHVKELRSRQGAKCVANSHANILELAVEVGQRREHYSMQTGLGFLQRMEIKDGDREVSLNVDEIASADGVSFPKVVTRHSRSSTGSETVRYEFSTVRLLDPSTVDAKALVALPEEVGTEVVDGIHHLAYRITPSGREWMSLYDPLTGKITKGPSTEPSTAPSGK
jgi:hypothetical protein